MKRMRSPQLTDCQRALKSLKCAIIEGTSHQYPQLIDQAVTAGATDEDIDRTAHEAMEALFESAEQPVTARELAYLWPVGNGH
jgi:hypothetical protein